MVCADAGVQWLLAVRLLCHFCRGCEGLACTIAPATTIDWLLQTYPPAHFSRMNLNVNILVIWDRCTELMRLEQMDCRVQME